MRNLSLGLIGLPAHPTCFTVLGSIFRFSLHFLYNSWFGAEVGTVVHCAFSVHIQEHVQKRSENVSLIYPC